MKRQLSLEERVAAAHKSLVSKGHVGPVVAVTTPTDQLCVGDISERFELASLTKLFTSLLLSALAEQSVVSLSQPVVELLPSQYSWPAGVEQITLEQLACHRSGLPRLPPGMRPGLSAKAARDPYAHIDADALYRALANTKLKGRPGLTKMRYSNFGVGLLGHALGLATGTGYQQALRDVVLEPLGLTSTDFTDDNLHQGRYRKRPVDPWHLNELAGAGGLRSNAADVLTFLEAVRDQDGPLAEAIKQTLIPRSEGRMSIGLGWLILNDGQLLMHNGGTLGARTEVRLERRTGLGVVVLGDSRRGTGAAAAKLLSPQQK